jgi:uridine phosphorylase
VRGHGIYLVNTDDGDPVIVFHPGVGAPAAVHHLERAIAGGARHIVVCGSALGKYGTASSLRDR